MAGAITVAEVITMDGAIVTIGENIAAWQRLSWR